MSQATGVGFSNFRVFKNPAFFGLAPISIFTGTNSSGKSSVFKGLKLLNNNAKDLGFLYFSGEGHKLGTFNLAKSRFSNSNIIRFALEIDHTFLLIIDYAPWGTEHGLWHQLMITIGTEYKETYEDKELILRISPAEHEDDEPYLRTYLNLRHFIQKKQEEYENNNLDDLIKKYGGVDNLNFNATSPRELINHIPTLNLKEANILSNELESVAINILSVRHIEPITANSDDEQGIKGIFEALDNIRFQERPASERLASEYFKKCLKTAILDADIIYKINNLTILDVINKNFVSNIAWLIKNELSYYITSLWETLKGVHYLEAIRANSQRLYSNQSQGTLFNTQLLELGNIQGMEFIEKWLKQFGIGEKLIINRIKGIATEVKIEREGEELDLIDLGYGVTQLLPIILYICSKFTYKFRWIEIDFDEFDEKPETKKEKSPIKKTIGKTNGPLLLIEEPEANLHPKLQSLLADFFVDVVKNYEVTLLLETHSEYLIRRLQVLTAAKEVEPKDTAIYYLNGDKEKQGKDLVTTININTDGSLTNDFGPGFIDEATNWKMELMRLKNAQVQNLN